MAKVFLTGASGYIGGSVLHSIISSQCDIEISCLNRDAEKSLLIAKAYPNVQTINGGLDDVEIIERVAKSADIVFHLALTDHEPSTRAILKGLTDSSRKRTGYLIQMSDATLVAAAEIEEGRYGEADSKAYDDLRDTTEIRSLITSNPTRIVDNLILAQQPHNIRTALIVGPCIYGHGTGPINQRTIQVPEIARLTLERKQGFKLGKGLNVWSTIHIEDLGDIFVALLKAALSGNDNVWNENGIYLPESGSIIVNEARKHGWIEVTELDEITGDQADDMSAMGAAIWGTNARLVSSRAQVQLGWAPHRESIEYDIPKVVAEEARRLGLS